MEAANKNIKEIVPKMVVTYKDWHDMLPYALHGYRTLVRTSTGATPYSLVYGTEAVLLVEVEILFLRVLAEAELDDVEWVQSRLDQLNVIEEKQLVAIYHVLPNNKDARGKWAPNYGGPYVVKQAFSRGASILANSEGQELGHSVNANAVKLFYP
ncbi:hypothetical protein CR513_08324, partial [Mucuna pruriens]